MTGATEKGPAEKVLIIEDDREIAAIERDFLEIGGFEVAIENDGLEGQRRALSGGFALIILDLMLPGKDGMAICRAIREKVDAPILMVTAQRENADKIRGLGFGADDYIVKPFSPTELVARVRSHIARYRRLTRGSGAPQSRDEIDLGWLRISKGRRRVFVDEIEISLAHKEYELLCFLASNPELVFSKEALYDRIWGEDTHGDIKTVAVHVSRLREKTEKNPSEPARIQTVWGAGYRLMP